MRPWYRRLSRFCVSWLPHFDDLSTDQKRKLRRSKLESLEQRKLLTGGNSLPAGDIVFISGNQLLDLNPLTGNQTVLAANATGVSDVLVAGDGSVYVAGSAGFGQGAGVFKLNAGQGQFTQLSATPADRLAIDTQGDLFGLQQQGGPQGGPAGFEINLTTSAQSPVLSGSSGTARDIAVGSDGTIYVSGTPNGLTEGIYKVNTATGQLTLVSQVEADNLEIDAHGNLFGTKSFGQYGSDFFEVAAGTSVAADLASPASTNAQDVSLAPDGGLTFSGYSVDFFGRQSGIGRVTPNGSVEFIPRATASSLAVVPGIPSVTEQGPVAAAQLGPTLLGPGSPRVFQLGATSETEVTPLEPNSTSDIVVGPDGKVIMAGQPQGAAQTGIYQQGAQPGQFNLVNTSKAQRLAVDAQGDIFGMEFSAGQYGNQGEIFEIAAGGGGAAVTLLDLSTTPAGAEFRDIAVGKDGNLLVAAKPTASSTDGIYKLVSSNLQLVSSQPAEEIEVDAVGNVLDLQVSGPGNEFESLLEIDPQTSDVATLYVAPQISATLGSGMLRDLAIDPQGNVLLSGKPLPGAYDGIYRLGPVLGELDLVSFSLADRIAAQPGTVPVPVNNLGESLAGARLTDIVVNQSFLFEGELFELVPGSTGETVLDSNTGAQPNDVQISDVAIGPDGRVIFAGKPDTSSQPGIYRQGATAGSFTLVTAQQADRIAVDEQGDIFGMQFGHGQYGGTDTSTALVFEINGQTSNQTTLINQQQSNAGFQFNDIAVTSSGKLFLAATTPTTGAGVYDVDTSTGALSLFAAIPSYRIEADVSGRVVGVTTSNPTVFQLNATTGAESVIYQSPPGSSDSFSDIAIGSDGNPLVSGQSGRASVDGIFRLSAASPTPQLVSYSRADSIALLGVELNGSGATATATEGAATNLTLATFTDLKGAGPLADYSGSIDWGDGSSASSASISGPDSNGAFTVTGSHTYAEESASESVIVTIERTGAPDASTFNGTVQVVDAPLTATAASVTATEGASFSGKVATFTDADPAAAAGDYTVTINWGDQTSASSGSITLSGGVFTIDGTHTYAEEASNLPVIVTISDHGASTSVTATANVSDAALTATAVAVAPTEGASFSGRVATFTDANPAAAAGDFTVTINWGDQTSATSGVATLSGGVFTVSGTHTYAEEASNLPVVVTISDHGASTSVTGTANVSDAALTATAVAVAATESANFSGRVATFTDANPAAAAGDYTVTIDWGDQTSATSGAATLSGGVFTVSGTHTYAEEASNLPVVVTISDHGASTSVTGTANVTDAALTATAVAFAATEGANFGGRVATFTDADPAGTAGDYQVTINWGDQTSATLGVVSLSGGVFTVTGSHTYAEEASNLPVVVTIADHGATTSVNGTANVADAALTATAVAVSATEGAGFSGRVAIFTDTNPAAAAGDYTVSIDWGDQTSATSGAVTLTGGVFTVTGSHTYAEEASNLPVVVTISDHGASTSVTGTANVSDAALTASAIAVSATEGAGFSGAVATFTDADPAGAVADYTATITWGDQTSASSGAVTLNGGVFTVTGSHTYPEEASNLPVTVTISDHGASASVTGTANVSDAALTATATAVDATEGANFSGRVATFTDADPAGTAGDYQVTINWGDQTSATLGVVSLSGGVFTVTGSHTYAEEASNLPVVVTIADHGATTSVNGTANVADASLSATAATILAAVNSTFTGQVATFSDADPAGAAGDYTAEIVWGDGSSSAGVVTPAAGGEFAVGGSHLYTQTAIGLPLSVRVFDGVGASAAAQGSATVSQLLPAVQVTSTSSLTATEGIATNPTLATFTDPNGAAALSAYSATIDWGDGSGTTSGTITGPDANGVFSVVGSHIYAEENSQGNHVTIAVHRSGALDASPVTDTETVHDATLSATVSPVHGQPGATLSNVAVATFTDADPAGTISDYSATIDWGDGTTTIGSVAVQGTGFVVTGSHAFADAGQSLIKVTIADTGGYNLTVSAAASIGTPHQQYVSAVYQDVLDRAPDSGGLSFWSQLLDNGSAVSSVAAAIAHSDEYYANFVIRPAYLKLLERAADDGGLTFWTQKMDAGLTDQELEAGFVASDEFFQAAGGTNTAWIDAVYKLLLGRTADQGGETFWNNQLAGGASRLQVALGIAGSQENNTQLINEDYFHYLGRLADAGGLAFWLQQFADGSTNEDVIAGFTGSAEYYDEHTS